MGFEIPIENHETDVLIIGGGAAGTMAAFECAKAGVNVILVTKGQATSGTTMVARGGFAAAIGEGDSPALHLSEVLEHGGELINPDLAKTWTRDIVDVAEDLLSWGAQFITNDKGELDLKQLPNHTIPRAIHHYDTTGEALTRVLTKKFQADNRICCHPLTSIIDLISEDGHVKGAWGIECSRGILICFSASQVILCTGGGSGLFYVNDNPLQVTGDGYVMGYRAGASLLGLEMIDFQAMCCSPEQLLGFAPHSTGFINAGAVFRNCEGEEFLNRYFPDTAENSMRSEVIIAMAKEIHAGRAGLAGGIFMDATQVPVETIKKQIPYVYESCLHRGIDITRTPLEVAPGSHTWLGGIEIDIDGRTRVPGLWAAGETAGGIHGVNRIGGSALSASMVFGRRSGRAAAVEVRTLGSNGPSPAIFPREELEWLSQLLDRRKGPLQADVLRRCKVLAHENLGPIRNSTKCAEAYREYEHIEQDVIQNMRLGSDAAKSNKRRGQEIESALGVRNFALLGRLLATAAIRREESRGSHYRLDYPEQDDKNWRVVTRLCMGPDGEINFQTDPVKSNN